jgi:hypothetical protein
MNHPPLVSRHLTHQHCTQLRHKGMYVFAETGDGESPDEAGAIQSTAYWCACTQKAFGPDGRPVSATSCTDGRGCCEH